LRVSALENVNFVFAVDCDDVISTNCVDVTSSLPLVLAVHFWLGLLEKCVLKFTCILGSALFQFEIDGGIVEVVEVFLLIELVLGYCLVSRI
jgi:hypothetical protein